MRVRIWKEIEIIESDFTVDDLIKMILKRQLNSKQLKTLLGLAEGSSSEYEENPFRRSIVDDMKEELWKRVRDRYSLDELERRLK